MSLWVLSDLIHSSRRKSKMIVEWSTRNRMEILSWLKKDINWRLLLNRLSKSSIIKLSKGFRWCRIINWSKMMIPSLWLCFFISRGTRSLRNSWASFLEMNMSSMWSVCRILRIYWISKKWGSTRLWDIIWGYLLCQVKGRKLIGLFRNSGRSILGITGKTSL